MLRYPLLLILLTALAYPSEAASIGGSVPEAQALIWGKECGWFGTAPICIGSCPRGYSQLFRSSDSSYLGISTLRVNDYSFGSPCAMGTKAFCCT